jgi:hypothetical protein
LRGDFYWQVTYIHQFSDECHPIEIYGHNDINKQITRAVCLVFLN